MRIVNDSGFMPGWLVGRVPPHTLCGTLIVKGTFQLHAGSAAIPAEEQDVPGGDLPEIETPDAVRYASDFAPIKPNTDILLVGDAHAAGGRPTTALRVGFHVGSWSKSLIVVGDRHATGTLISSVTDPQPFSSIPLSWTRAYGGPGFAGNPTGRGASDPPTGQPRRLPNIVRQEEISAPAGTALDPAGFGPLSAMWPQRMQKARRATYDDKWLRETWPGPPRDFDWTYFNAAPSDQQLTYRLRGDERIRLENLRKDHALFESRLPGVRVRWFIDELVKGEPRFREVPLALDTLWIDATAGKLVLVWRGVAAIASKKMREIRHHFIVREFLKDAPAPVDHYRSLLPRRLRELDEAAQTASAVIPEIPPVVIPPIAFDWAAWEKEFEDTLREAGAIMENPPPAAAKYPAMDLAQAGASLGLKGPVPMPAPPADPATMAAQIRADLAAIAQEDPTRGGLLGSPPSAADLDAAAAVDRIEKEFADSEKEEKPEATPEPGEPAWTRQRCAEFAAHGGDFSGQNLAGLDLSGLDLRRLKFRGAVLKNARLRSARLDGADLTGAVLAGVNLNDCSLLEAGAERADFAGCDLTGGDLTGAALREADFTGSKLTGAKLVRVQAESALFIECDFAEATLEEGSFPQADFSGSKLAGVSLRGATLAGASAYGVSARGADLSGADLTKFRAGERADLAGLRCPGVRASGSVWESCVLDGADFSLADLRQSNFADASLVGVTFLRADLRKARLPEADLTNAVLVKANLFQALLEGARLTHADLKGACLYEAEFLDADVQGADLRMANVKGTKLA